MAEQGYHLNIARVIPEKIGKRFGPYHRHFCNVFLGDCLEAEAVEKAREISAQFPAPEFKCDLTVWRSYGQTVLF